MNVYYIKQGTIANETSIHPRKNDVNVRNYKPLKVSKILYRISSYNQSVNNNTLVNSNEKTFALQLI